MRSLYASNRDSFVTLVL